jgi:hypothetical protein
VLAGCKISISNQIYSFVVDENKKITVSTNLANGSIPVYDTSNDCSFFEIKYTKKSVTFAKEHVPALGNAIIIYSPDFISTGSVVSVDPERVCYDANTLPGYCGALVYALIGSDYFAVAIHGGSVGSANFGCRPKHFLV